MKGVVCSAEGRVQKINKAVNPPGDARSDALIICDLAKRLGQGAVLLVPVHARDLRGAAVASKGGIADYYGITWERIEDELGVFWPCPRSAIPAPLVSSRTGASIKPTARRTSRLRNGASRAIRRRVVPAVPDDGRVVSHYLSGTQTRRIGPLVEQCPEPRIELHPRLAERHGIVSGDWMRITTRRAAVGRAGQRVKTSVPTRIFIPVSLAGRRSANLLTHRTLDPRSKIPEYKVSACRIEKAEAPADLDGLAARETGWLPDGKPRPEWVVNERLRVLRRPIALHRLPRLLWPPARSATRTAACR
jgi:assimilatory nitrate reductase catalytic subunit